MVPDLATRSSPRNSAYDAVQERSDYFKAGVNGLGGLSDQAEGIHLFSPNQDSTGAGVGQELDGRRSSTCIPDRFRFP